MSERIPEERRTEPRKQKNLFCQLECGEKCHPAVILDVSSSGMFVRTAAALAPGTDVEVTIRVAGGKTWKIGAQVAREPQANSKLKSIQARGLGLRITRAPDDYVEFVESL
jgi:hypothetical protein